MVTAQNRPYNRINYLLSRDQRERSAIGNFASQTSRSKAPRSTMMHSGRAENMRSESTLRTSKIEITDDIREAYKERDPGLDNDPDAPTLPPELWANATVGKYYRPTETQISFRIDNEVLDWLKSKGEGHLSRINEILRERMAAERQLSGV